MFSKSQKNNNISITKLSKSKTPNPTFELKKITNHHASSKKENEWSRHQHLFEKNVRKTKKRFVNFEKKGSGVHPLF